MLYYASDYIDYNTSSTSSNSSSSYIFGMWEWRILQGELRMRWKPIRCFKNQYTPEQYKVTFHFNWVRWLVAEESVWQDWNVKQPSDLSEAWIAVEWYDNSEYLWDEFDFNDTISSDIDLYAKYSCTDENLCRKTVNFETNGWSSISSVQTDENFMVSVPQSPTKEWFVFMWWYEDENLKYKFDFSTQIVEDKTLYAK